MRERLALAALIAFCTLWRLPFIGDPPWLNDEGVYATVGRALYGGEALYRQVWENKPPAIYILYGGIERLAGSTHVLVGARLAALVAAVLAQLAVYGLARLAAGPATGLLTVGLTGVLVDLPLLEGTAANAEIFVIALTGGAMWLLWYGMGVVSVLSDGQPPAGGGAAPRAVRRRWWSLLAAGIAFGLATLFKYVAGADLVAGCTMLALWPLTPTAPRRTVATLALVAGVGVPLGLVAGWLASRGLLGDALYATAGYNQGYVTKGQSLHAPLVTLVSALVLLVLFGLAAHLWRRSRPRGVPPVGAAVCWWLALATLGAMASGRSYPHYYLQLVPPLAIGLALLIGCFRAPHPEPSLDGAAAVGWPRGGPMDADAGVQRRVLAGLIAVWAVGLPLLSALALQRDPPDPAPGSNRLAYYAYSWQHLTGALSDTAYGNRIDPRVERNISVAAYLRAHPAGFRRLYVWGNSPWIYYLSTYEHAARFLSAYYNPPIPGGEGQVVRSIRRDPPSYIVVIEPPVPGNAALAQIVARRYRLVWQRDNARVYLLRAAGPGTS